MLIEVPNASFQREKDPNGIRNNPFTFLKEYRPSKTLSNLSCDYVFYDEYIKEFLS